jgi:hypothetical protein
VNVNEEGIGFQGEEIKWELNVFCKEELKVLYTRPNLIREIKFT